MLLRHRAPGIESPPPSTTKGFEHLDREWLAVLRWLNSNRVEYVLVGAAAEAVRGRAGVRGPVAIVPAPYQRNYERLAKALWAAHARRRVEGEAGTVPIKLTAEKLAAGNHWAVRCGAHDVEIEASSEGTSGYQELLYEAGRFVLAEDLAVEVASPEYIEHYAHFSRTGATPEIQISRRVSVEQDQL
jgi:hypothetical protein